MNVSKEQFLKLKLKPEIKLTVVFYMIINLIEYIHHCFQNQDTTFIIVGKSSLFIIFAILFSFKSMKFVSIYTIIWVFNPTFSMLLIIIRSTK